MVCHTFDNKNCIPKLALELSEQLLPATVLLPRLDDSAKPLGVGRQQLILFLCVVCCVLCVVCCVLCIVCACDVLNLSIFWDYIQYKFTP
jgi:hypothetical protein